MKLFYAIGACSVSADILFREAELDLTPVKVDLKTHTTEHGEDYYAINPKGYVPALQLDSGEIVTEAPAVLLYIANQNPAAGLVPQVETSEWYQNLEWLIFVSTELHKTFGPYHNPHSTEEAKKAAAERLQKRFTYMDEQLAGKEYLLGEKFMAADSYAFAILRWVYQFGIDISYLKNLTAYIERVQSREKVQEALAFEGLVS